MNKDKLVKYLFFFFFVSIIMTAVGIVNHDGSNLASLAEVVFLVCHIFYIVVLWLMKDYNKNYRISAIWSILNIVATVLISTFVLGTFYMPALNSLSHHSDYPLMNALFASLGTFILLCILMLAVDLGFSLVATHYEYKGHGELMKDYDESYTYKWERLWRYTLIATIVIIVTTIALIVFALSGNLSPLITLFSIGTLVASIALTVISVIKVVYLYKMHDIIKEYRPLDEDDVLSDDTGE